MFDGAAVIEGLRAVDPSGLGGAALASWVVGLERLRAAVDAASIVAVGEFDRRGSCQADGAVTTASWLAQHGRMSGAAARQRVEAARALPALPLVAAALDQGRMSFEEVRLFTRARVPATAAAMGRDEAMLVGLAAGLRVDDVARALHRWRSMADADGSAPAAPVRLDAARVGDRVVLAGELGAVDGEIVLGHLDRLREELRRAEEADGGVASPAERRAAALVEMARRSAGAAGTTVARPLVTLVVPADDLAAGRGGSTDRGAHVPDPALRRLRATPPPPSSSTPSGNPSTSAGGSAPPRRPNAGRWWSGTAGACSPAATAHRAGARPTTSTPGRTAGRPTWPTWPCSARGTTTSSTRAAGPSAAPPTRPTGTSAAPTAPASLPDPAT